MGIQVALTSKATVEAIQIMTQVTNVLETECLSTTSMQPLRVHSRAHNNT